MTMYRSMGDEPVGGGPAPTGSFASRPTFVGREDELELLVRGLDEAHDGNARFFILVGEAGIGKTRLADAFASPAGRRAARLPGHGRPTARKVSGIEGAVVDNEL